ncbi:hypothetical protein SDC9_181631 [bioreactor metagenome]|uniref:Uncharacterized protein n=1 Tax=bioreactor metagenome TaxID=1076179 RepID=A0A645H569_9ZZZZ
MLRTDDLGKLWAFRRAKDADPRGMEHHIAFDGVDVQILFFLHQFGDRILRLQIEKKIQVPELQIKVNGGHLFALMREGNGEICGDHGFPDAAFRAENRDDLWLASCQFSAAVLYSRLFHQKPRPDGFQQDIPAAADIENFPNPGAHRPLHR